MTVVLMRANATPKHVAEGLSGSPGRREFLGTPSCLRRILSSAAPGRLNRVDLVTSDFVGFGARSRPMVVNPRHQRSRRSEPIREGRLSCCQGRMTAN